MTDSSIFQWSSVFGSSLVSKGDATVDTDCVLSGKYIGIYFSAHWCPPCRGFTPELAKFYTEMKSRGDFEIVFVSSDKSDEQFREYFGEMPWLALPYSDREKKGLLSSKFKVQGIPTFVILDKDGTLITTKGREKASSASAKETFPWKPLSLEEELGTSFTSKSGPVTNAAFAGKIYGLYFSAHWCPPCRGFTPKLVEFYNARKAQGKDDFEVIFVSSDRDLASFDEYYAEMPWLAIPFGDSRKETLSDRFEVQGIPTLVIIDANGNVINKSAVGNVRADPKGAKFPFYPEPIEDLGATTESYGTDLNSTPSFLVFMENCDDGEQADAREAVLPFAVSLAKEKASVDGPEIIFFTAFGPSQIGSRVRQLTQIGAVEKAEGAKMVILDIPDEGGFYVSDATEVTAETVGKFIADYKAKSLPRKQLG